VRSVRADGALVRVGVDGAADDGGTFDGAVLAVPAPVAARLLHAEGQLAQWLATVRTRSATAVALVLDRAPRVGWFGLSFPRASPPGRALVAATVQGNKPGLGGSTALVLLPAPDRAEELAAAEPETAVEALLAPLEAALPGVRERVVRARHYALPHGYTLFPPGYVAHLGSFQEAWLPPCVALAGGYRVAPTVEGAVRSGERAAARLLAG
jgi:protoporphyrinogen oxidase